jgi:ribonuclease HI
MEVAMGLVPLDLHVQAEALKARIRTRQSSAQIWDGLAVKKKGHQRHWDDILDEICPNNFPIDRIPQVYNWQSNQELEREEVVIYTDGSKEDGSAGAGWAVCVGDEVIEEESIFLGESTTVFQAEVVAIQRSLQWLIADGEKVSGKNVQILSDSQAAIQAIHSHTIVSKVVKDCASTLTEAKKNHWINIGWVRGHADNTGNELADYLAKEGNKLPVQSVGPELPVPYATMKQRVNNLITAQWQRRWSSSEDCRATKYFCPKVDTGKLKRVIKMSRENLNLLFQAITGHGLFAAHLSKWKDVDNICKLCGEEDETALHVWDSCPALEKERRERELDPRNRRSKEVEIIRFFEIKAVKEMMSENSAGCKAAGARTQS